MRSYGHYCAIARALDVVGDRWALLVVRELLVRGACRYKDLQVGLPGISTNLLADRLRELGEAGIVRRVDPSPPVATARYELTPRGQELGPVLRALGVWGAELMASPQGTDVFRSHWLAFPMSRLVDSAPDEPPVVLQLRIGGEPMIVETADGGVRTRAGVADDPDAVLEGTPEVVIATLRGRLEIGAAEQRGLHFEGDRAAVERLRPAELT